MDIGNVMDELGTAVDMIEGLRVFPYWADRVVAPAAIVSWPELDYDTTYARGADMATFPLTVVVGKVNARASRDEMAKYLDGSGPNSIKQAIESYSATAWHSARVTSAGVAVISVAGTDYLGAEFQIDVIGSGS